MYIYKYMYMHMNMNTHTFGCTHYSVAYEYFQ